MRYWPDLTSSVVASKRILYILTVSCLAAVLGCQSLPKTPEELTTYVQDPEHGLLQEKEVGAVRMQVQYRPTDLLVNQELQHDYSEEKVAALRHKYGQYAYFILSYSQENKEALYQPTSYGQFSETLQNLAFRMDRFAQLTTAQQDTVPIADFVYPRTYGYGGSTQVMLVFDRKNIPDTEWVQLVVDDVGLGAGSQRFRFRTQDIDLPLSVSFNR